jgi:D-3-phosphoglycerate dehydrogenase / 2-oxoglutarate reductase
VVRAGTGTDSIDLGRAAELGVRVVVVPGSARSVAEHAIGLLLALSRGTPRLDRAMRAGRWEKASGHGRELLGKCLGAVGFGRVGRSVAEIASALGMSVVACDRSPERGEKRAAAERLGVDFAPLHAVLARADAVSVQVPLDATTRKLIDESALGLMKRDAVLVNVGRGGVVDEVALHAALVAGRISGAALDVFETEPPGAHPLLLLDNFIGTPHVAAQTVDAQTAIGDEVVRVIEEFARGPGAEIPLARPALPSDAASESPGCAPSPEPES